MFIDKAAVSLGLMAMRYHDETAFHRAASGAELVLAPRLILVEAANVLLRKRRRGELSAQELGELLQALVALPIRLCEHASLNFPEYALAEAQGLSVHDAFYLALADQQGARLIPSDDALSKAARNLGLT